jgi:hypothetical protein
LNIDPIMRYEPILSVNGRNLQLAYARSQQIFTTIMKSLMSSKIADIVAPRPPELGIPLSSVLEHKNPSSRGKIPQLLFYVMAFLTAALVRISTGPMTIDDAYITFRYARNIADGLGFVYNNGEHVLGTTTPLWALILATLSVLGAVDLPITALVLSAVFDGATACLLYLLATGLGFERKWAALCSVLFAFNTLSSAFAAGGMETSLFTCLIVSAFLACVTGRSVLAGALAGLATLTRPEGVLVALLVAGSLSLRTRKLPLRALALYALVVLPWALFATSWFGHPLPQSMIAKTVHYQEPPLRNATWLLSQFGLPGFNQFVWDRPAGQPWLLVGLLVALGLVLLILRYIPTGLKRLRVEPYLWPLVAFAPIYATAYAAAGLRSIHLFPWYSVPLAPFYLMAIVAIARWLSVGRSHRLGPVFALALCSWTALGLNLGREADRQFLAPYGMTTIREEAFLDAARLLEPRLIPQSVVALPEIGAFGYATNALILDTAGLVSPQAAKYYPLPPGFKGDIAAPPDLIRTERPAFLVGYNLFLPTQLLDADWFQRDYRLIAQFHAPLWGGSNVLVYERLDDGH